MTKMTFKDAARLLCQVVRDLPVTIQERAAEDAASSTEELDEAVAVVEKETGLA